MTDRDQAPAPLPAARSTAATLPSVGLAVVCALHAIPLAWAAWTLPVTVSSWLSLSLGLLAALHGGVSVLALLRRARPLAITWFALSVYSLLLLLGVTIVVASSAIYLSALYQDIGVAVSAALAGVWGLLVLLTVPVSAWGLAYTWRWLWPGRGRALLGAGLLTLALVAGSGLLRSAARAAQVPGADSPALLDRLAQVAQQSTRRAPPREPVSLLHGAPARCNQRLAEAGLTLLVTALGLDARPFAACLQASDTAGLAHALERLLSQRAAPGAPIKLDLVRGLHELVRIHPLLDALSLPPALDGVCTSTSCFAPWQLVTFDAFTRYRPLPAVRDASFGAALDELALALGAASPAHDPLWRIETRSLLVAADGVVPYVRMRPVVVPADSAARKRAVALAGQHIVAAQRPDGAFRYLLDPFSGQHEDRLNLPRQAGTTLALCELVAGPEGKRAAERALVQLASFERRSGSLSAISDSSVEAELGPSALPLIALASCRARVGPVHDVLIGRLAAMLLALQRRDGSFQPMLDLATGKPVGDYEPLYAGGQAVFALVLVEQLARATASPTLPAPLALHDAVERAMSYYADHYWPRALRSLFYLEENWHCLAARAALRTHPHARYEDFCLDYVAFKSRLILEPADGVSPEHVGGYALSDMFPPHSTATAGFGEAMAAALAIKHARGADASADRARLELALSFVLRQQWTADNCFACAATREAVGAFSESEASSTIRIDYVQHAMAALGHGDAALELTSGAR
ncbi:MAG: hypothetical protein JWN48_4371 [Myxococcaceae bacterium]|nr:hypothetical protein [Myxococcaceae bacterium]